MKLLDYFKTTKTKVLEKPFKEVLLDKVVSTPSTGTRKSYPNFQDGFLEVVNELKIVKPDFILELVPAIRKLVIVNENVGLAFSDLVQLTNTGYKIYFDRELEPKKVEEMRLHLKTKTKTWCDGTAGLPGIINKIIAQIYIGGAASVEWVINREFNGIASCIMVNPEDIRWNYKTSTGRYEAYQKIYRSYLEDVKNQNITQELVKLNPFTYKYYGLNSDTEKPYGIPPFIAALLSIKDEKVMRKNISYIIEQLGLLGFLQLLIEKPGRREQETEESYIARLNNLLQKARSNTKDGMSDGVVVGYKDDHQFQFNSTTKNLGNISEIFGLNQNLLANGLKYPGSFMGIPNKTETNITIIFTKMLSQLANVQNMVKEMIEFGLELELRLAGFKFKDIEFEFKPSTITDDLKIQQADEIKIRNCRILYQDGIISQEEYADRMGYPIPDQPKPRIVESEDPSQKEVKRKDREKDKDDSDRRVRDKNKTQPKRKDTNTKPV